MLLKTSIIGAMTRERNKKTEASRNIQRGKTHNFNGSELRRKSRYARGLDREEDFSMDYYEESVLAHSGVQAEGGGLDNFATLNQKGDMESSKKAMTMKSNKHDPPFQKRNEDIGQLTELQKYKEI